MQCVTVGVCLKIMENVLSRLASSIGILLTNNVAKRNSKHRGIVNNNENRRMSPNYTLR